MTKTERATRSLEQAIAATRAIGFTSIAIAITAVLAALLRGGF